jgi:hypothetical protein
MMGLFKSFDLKIVTRDIKKFSKCNLLRVLSPIGEYLVKDFYKLSILVASEK